jgi:hypothetical protein
MASWSNRHKWRRSLDASALRVTIQTPVLFLAAYWWPVVLTPLTLAAYASMVVLWVRVVRSRRLWIWRFNVRSRLGQRARLRQSEQHRAAFDHQENAETTPPTTEQIRWISLWLVELFLPLDAGALAQGLRRLGWDRENLGALGVHNDAVAWLEEARLSGGPTWTEGAFRPRGALLYPLTLQADVPTAFPLVTLRLVQLGPSITVLVANFRIAEDDQTCLDKAIRTPTKSRIEPISWTGERRFPPTLVKSERVSVERRRIRSAAASWLADLFPGRMISMGVDLPSWDLLTSETAPLSASLHDGHRHDWRGPLGLMPAEQWTFNPPDKAFVLATPMGSERAEVRPSFVGLRHELISAVGKYGDKSLPGVTGLLHEQVACLLPVLALRAFVAARGRSLAALQDTAFSVRRKLGAHNRVRQLAREVLGAQRDLLDLEHVAEKLATDDLMAWWLQTNAANPVLVDKPSTSLLSFTIERLRTDIQATVTRANRLASAIRGYSDLQLASSNLRLQWAIVGLTVVVIVLTGLGVWRAFFPPISPRAHHTTVRQAAGTRAAAANMDPEEDRLNFYELP